MQTKLRTYQIVLTILVLPICLFLFVSFGWSSYATITERPGLNGSMYMYYDLTILQFTIYTGIVALAGLLFGLTIFGTAFFTDRTKLNKWLKYFLIFIIVFILCEIYLQTRFIGKG